MKIANEQTFKQFDKLKDQMFAHKQKSAFQSTPKPTTSRLKSFRNRIVIPLIFLGGAFYLINRNAASFIQQLVNRQIISYHQKLCLDSSACFIKNIHINQQHKTIFSLLNKIYLSKLQADYIYLTNKGKENKLSVQTTSTYAFWIFSFFNKEKVKLINQYGDLVQRQRQSKLMVSDLLRLWGKQKNKLLKRQKLFQTYQSSLKTINPTVLCQKLHFMAMLNPQKQQRQLLFKQCIEESSKIHLKIKQFINTRLKQQKYTK